MSQNERTLSVHNEHEFLFKMEQAGLIDRLAQLVIGSPNNTLAKDLVGMLEAKHDQNAQRKIVFYFQDGTGNPLANVPLGVVINHNAIPGQTTGADGEVTLGTDAGTRVKFTLWLDTPNQTSLSYKVTNARFQTVTYEISRVKV
jgi:hypothetical protein